MAKVVHCGLVVQKARVSKNKDWTSKVNSDVCIREVDVQQRYEKRVCLVR